MSYPILALRDISTDTRKHMPDEDFAGKHRSFPIEAPEDVHAAVDSIGQAGDDNYSSDELKANIKKIAKRKGFESHLPASWKDETVEACDSVSMAMSDRGPQFAVRLSQSMDRIKRVPIALLGKFQKGAQKFAITKQIMADMVANFRKRTAATVVDYEHASEQPDVAQGQPIPAAGWIESLDDRPDDKGILWGTVKFTARALDMLKADELRYFSPVIEYARDKTTGESQGATLLSGALTLRPFLDAMPAIAMSDWQKFDRGDAASRKEKPVKVILADRAARTVKVVSDDNTETVLIVEGLDAPPAVIRLSDLKRGQDGKYNFAELPQDGDRLVASEVIRAMNVDRELDDAVKAGKITPAQRPHFERMALSDLPGFREVVKTLPVQVDLSEHGLGGGAAEGDEKSRALAAINDQIAKKQTADPKLSYGNAWKLVASENRALVETYNQLAAKGGK